MAEFFDNLDVLRQINLHERVPRRLLQDRKNPLELYTDDEFRGRYRLSKETVIDLVEELSVDLQRPTERSSALPVLIQVVTVLRFYAVGSFQLMHGDEEGLSQATMSRLVKAISIAIATRKNEYISFPSTREEVMETQQQFFDYCNFPGVVGAIDCTHIGISKPVGPNAGYFLNRKNRYSINTQAVCNHERKITSIVARWPGSAHDSRIFDESALKTMLENRHNASEVLLGDNGYPCLPYLMTPLLHPEGREERSYNFAHKRGRCIIERTFGMWKRRFPCLNHLRVHLETVFPLIVACAILWNVSITRREPELPGPGPLEDGDYVGPHQLDGVAGRLRRQQIIQQHFTE